MDKLQNYLHVELELTKQHLQESTTEEMKIACLAAQCALESTLEAYNEILLKEQVMMPSIGRIVHYTNLGDKDGKYPPEVQAAVITGVYRGGKADETGAVKIENGAIVPANKLGDKAEDMNVDLTVFYRTGYFQTKAVPFAEVPTRGHWNWPPR